MVSNSFLDGDSAVEDFKTKLQSIYHSRSTFQQKLNLISDEFNSTIGPWSLKGDDRVLSMIRNEACSSVEDIVVIEIKLITGDTKNDSSQILAMLDDIEKEIDTIPWLEEGSRSSIGVLFAFARSSIPSE